MTKNKVKLFPSLWAMPEAELAKIETLYSGHVHDVLSGLERDSGVVETQLESFVSDIAAPGFSPDVSVVDGIGVLRIEGVITQKPSIFTMIFGGATLDTLAADFKALLAMEDIHTIVLDIDSAGGTVAGVQDFAGLVFESRQKKNIISISSSVMTSAAMWIGAAAESVYISSETVITGSIGVLTTHVDVSALQEKLGVKTTEITAGKDKRITSSFAPLTDAGRSVLQSQVDKIMEAFVGDIARFRNTTTQNVGSNMADGKIFIGDDAVEAGLVDDITTLDLLIETISNGGNDMSLFAKKEATIENLQAEHGGLYRAVMDVGIDSIKAQHEENVKKAEADGHGAGLEAGAVAERARIQGINDCTIPGQEELGKKLVADGKTTPGEAAIQMINANKKANADGLEKIKNTSALAVEDETEETIVDKSEMTAKQEWDADPKLANEFASFEAFESMRKNDSNYRVLSK